jgi:hypothetical protein
MRLAERVKIFTGSNTDELEQEFNAWYDDAVHARDSVPALKGNPLNILERSITIRNYEGEETYALAVFYEDMLLEEHEKGKDRGHHLNTGVSLIPGNRR